MPAHLARIIADLSDTPGFIHVAGQRLEMARWPGDDKLPIVLLHEGLGSVATWRDFPARLAAATGREIVAWSREGYGRSMMTSSRFDPDYMHRESARVSAVLDALGVDRAHLLGHSDGGSIALLAAAMIPERTASLILEAPHVFVEDVTVQSIASVGRNYASTELGARLARYHDDPDRMFWRWNRIWLDPRFRDWSIDDFLPRITAPALFLQGLQDQYGTLEQLDRLAAVLPEMYAIEIDACGHSPHRDQCDAVLAAIRSFLDQRP